MIIYDYIVFVLYNNKITNGFYIPLFINRFLFIYYNMILLILLLLFFFFFFTKIKIYIIFNKDIKINNCVYANAPKKYLLKK